MADSLDRPKEPVSIVRGGGEFGGFFFWGGGGGPRFSGGRRGDPSLLKEYKGGTVD